MKYFIIIAIALLPIHSCSTFKEMGQNLVTEGHFRLYTYPDKAKNYLEMEKFEKKEKSLKEKKSRYRDIVIVSINNFKARLQPLKISYLDRAQNTNHEVIKGGIEGYKSYFDILRTKLGEDLHIISSGSMLSSAQDSEKVVFYMNYLGLDVASIGLSEFQLSMQKNYLSELDSKFKNAKFDTILSNVFDLSQNGPFKFKHILSTTIKSAGDLKIGYIGLIAPNQVDNIDSKKLTGLYFEKLPVKLLKESTELRKLGADIIIAMISEGIDCTSQQSQELNIDENKVNFLPVDEKVCNQFENQTIEALKQLPPNYIDAVFTSGKNSKVANYIQGYPVIQNYDNGTDFSWLKLTYDFKQQRLIKDKTQILQPVSTCHNFFKETEDCYTEEVLRNVEIKKARFLDEKIRPEKIPTHK